MKIYGFIVTILLSIGSSSGQEKGGVIDDSSISIIVEAKGRPDYVISGRIEQSLRLATVKGYDTIVAGKSEGKPKSKRRRVGIHGSYETWLDLLIVREVFVGAVEAGARYPMVYRKYTALPAGEDNYEIDREFQKPLRTERNFVFLVYLNPITTEAPSVLSVRSKIYIVDRNDLIDSDLVLLEKLNQEKIDNRKND
jgi:hypothetical protein